MKRAFLFLALAASIWATGCKKDKAPVQEAPVPEYDGPPTAISGVWALNVYSFDALVHEYSFGTNLIYKIETGKPRETKVETGTYTLAPITGTPNSYTLALRPDNGIPYTITASEVTGITAIFEQSSPQQWKFGFLRK